MKDIPLRNVEQLGAAIRSKRKEQALSRSALAAKLDSRPGGYWFALWALANESA